MFSLIEASRSTGVGWGAGGSLNAVTINANASAHTWGSWSDITTSTAHDATGLFFTGFGITAAWRGLVDLAIHTANEDILISNILVDFNRQDCQAYSAFFPCIIPAGSGISARLRATTGSVGLTMAVSLVYAPNQTERYLSKVETIGTDTTDGSGASSGTLDTGGSQIDPGGTINNYGSWKELSSGIVYPCRHALLMMGYILNAASAIINWKIQVGSGASGQEQVIWDGIFTVCNTTTDTIYPYTFDNPFVVGSGQRVAIRASCDSNDATDRLFQAAMYLFRDED